MKDHLNKSRPVIQSRPNRPMEEVKVVLDHLGRALDEKTGEYMRLVRTESPPHFFTVVVGGLEGAFLTVDEDEILTLWEAPQDWAPS